MGTKYNPKNVKKNAGSTLSDKAKKNIKLYSCIAAAVIVLVIAIVALDLIPHTDGSLRVTFGKLLGATDKDIVVNRRTNNNKTDNYFKIGSFDMPEGYVNDEMNGLTGNSLSQVFYMRPVDKDSPYYLFTVSGSVYDKDGAYELLNNKNVQKETNEITSIISDDKIGETPVNHTEYVGFTVADFQPVENKYLKRALVITPAFNGEFSILVQISAHHSSFGLLPSDEEMLSKAVELLDCVTVY